MTMKARRLLSPPSYMGNSKRTSVHRLGMEVDTHRRQCQHVQCKKRVFQRCMKCRMFWCPAHAFGHACSAAAVSSIRDFLTGYGRIWFQEDCWLMVPCPEYQRISKLLANIHARDARLPEDPAIVHHRTQQKLERQLHTLGGQTDRFYIAAFTATGSDANNMLQLVANYWIRQHGGPQARGKGACVLVMEGAVVASRGRLSALSSREWAKQHHELFGAAECDDKWVQDHLVQLPLSYAHEQELVTGKLHVQRNMLSTREAAALQALEAKVEALRDAGLYPGVLLLELITADNMRGFSAIFLYELRELLSRLCIALVVDEVMTAVRCGCLFSYLYYGDKFKPDFITVGKGMLFSGVVAVNTSQHLMDNLRFLPGDVTSGIDEQQAERAARSLQVAKELDLPRKVVLLGHAIREHLQPSLCSIPDTYLHGIGGMWWTNLPFDSELEGNIQYQRILPPLNLPVSQLRELLVVRQLDEGAPGGDSSTSAGNITRVAAGDDSGPATSSSSFDEDGCNSARDERA